MDNQLLICYCRNCKFCTVEGCKLEVVLVVDGVCSYIEPREE